MKRWVSRIIVAVGFLIQMGEAVTVFADQSRLLTVDEVLMLAEHLRDFPPWTSDITVLVEFTIPSVPEKTIRKQVKSFIHRDNQDRGIPLEGDKVTAEIEREVNRLLGEQLVPRRIKERWRKIGLSYRVDEVRTQTGLEVIDDETPWLSSFLYIFDSDTKSADTARIDYGQKIISVFGARHGNLQQYRDVWAGGTLGRSSVQLKAGLGMPLMGDDRSLGPDLKLVQDVADGTHEYFELRVLDVDGERHAREFTFRPRAGGSIRFTTPASSFSPVYEVEVTDPEGVVAYSLFSEEVGADGVVTKWTEKKLVSQTGKLKEVRLSLLDRKLWQDLPEDTFSLKRPEGWSLVDHRPEELELTNFTGKRILGVNNNASQQTIPMRSGGWAPYVLIGNAIVLIVVAVFWHFRKSRK